MTDEPIPEWAFGLAETLAAHEDRIFREESREVTGEEQAAVVSHIVGPLLAAKDKEIERLGEALRGHNAGREETVAERDRLHADNAILTADCERLTRERDEARAALRRALPWTEPEIARGPAHEGWEEMRAAARRALGEGEE